MALKLAPDTIARLTVLRQSVASAAFGSADGLVQAFAHEVGKSKKTIYRWLNDQAGYDSGRKQRRDRGKSRVSEAQILMAGTIKAETGRANGKILASTATAMEVMSWNGQDPEVSVPHMNRLLRARRLDNKSAAVANKAPNTQKMQASGPNHVHMIDPSVCVIYYLKGKQYIQREAEFNKNKKTTAEIKLKVLRYVRVDRASAAIDVKYYEAAGESQALMFDFLMHSWGKQDHRLDYGVPKILYWDKGSANTSHAVCRMLSALGVEAITHAAEHPWAKGAVEKANDIVERGIESLLRFETVPDIDALNAAAFNWVRAFNAGDFKYIDARIHRAGGAYVRNDLWQSILSVPGALVELPSRAACQWFMVGHETTRDITNCGFTFVHPEIGKSRPYSLREYAEYIHNGERLVVSPVLLKGGAVRVEIPRLGAEALIAEVLPEQQFTQYGEAASATVYGEWASAPDTVGERQAKAMGKLAFGTDSILEAEAKRRKQATPFGHLNDGKGLATHSAIPKVQGLKRLLPKPEVVQTPAMRGARALIAAQQAHHDDRLMPLTQCLLRLAREWGAITPRQNQALRADYPAGMTENELNTLITQGDTDVTRTQKIA